MPQDRWERIRGGLYGLLIGDALGVPYEFSSPTNIPERTLIEMSPPSGFARAHPAIPAGTWSDDGAQALVLLDSLIACSSLDLKQFTDGLLAWYRSGFMTPDDHTFSTSAFRRCMHLKIMPKTAIPSRAVLPMIGAMVTDP